MAEEESYLTEGPVEDKEAKDPSSLSNTRFSPLGVEGWGRVLPRKAKPKLALVESKLSSPPSRTVPFGRQEAPTRADAASLLLAPEVGQVCPDTSERSATTATLGAHKSKCHRASKNAASSSSSSWSQLAPPQSIDGVAVMS